MIELPGLAVDSGSLVSLPEGGVVFAKVHAIEDKKRLDFNLLQEFQIILDMDCKSEWLSTKSRSERFLQWSLGEEALKIEVGVNAEGDSG